MDGFSSEKIYVPECVLLLKWQLKDKAPDPLNYKVKLLGTGEENFFFRIVHNPGEYICIHIERNKPYIDYKSIYLLVSFVTDE